MLSRRKLLWSAAGSAGASVSYPFGIEPRWLDVTHTPVRLAAVAKRQVRILHLTDLHASLTGPLSHIDSAITAGLAQRPDLICLTGDFITHKDDFNSEAYAAVLSRLPKAAPTFAVLGNHDGGSWAKTAYSYPDHILVERILEQAGVRLLHNDAVTVPIAGTTLNVVGVGDLWADEINAKQAFRAVAHHYPTVLLSHNPDSKDVVSAYPWDLMLCGHTHGGQVLIPMVGPHYAPVKDKRFVAGLHPWEGRQIYTSRGVGSIASVRFRCRPEVAMLDLQLG